MSEFICSICHGDAVGYGNNAHPVNDGRCCDPCDAIVIRARINQIRRAERKEQRPAPDMYEGPFLV